MKTKNCQSFLVVGGGEGGLSTGRLYMAVTWSTRERTIHGGGGISIAGTKLLYGQESCTGIPTHRIY